MLLGVNMNHAFKTLKKKIKSIPIKEGSAYRLRKNAHRAHIKRHARPYSILNRKKKMKQKTKASMTAVIMTVMSILTWTVQMKAVLDWSVANFQNYKFDIINE